MSSWKPNSMIALSLVLLSVVGSFQTGAAEPRPRLIVETDAGGDPDDEQSLVRLLVYANEFDIEGIIANRPVARPGENKNPIRDGLGIVTAMVKAYGRCYPNLVKHDSRYPTPQQLLSRTVAGYDDTDDGVELIIRAVDAQDPRPLWFSNWGTDHGAAESCLKRALDRVLQQRGPAGYAAFKSRLRLSSADKFPEHTAKIEPPFSFWLDASHPPLEGKRWYHRFSALTATAGDFDIERDVRNNHGPLGAMYPVNTGLRQKEGDTMMFLYLIPTGMNDPAEPTWGSWGGRYGHNESYPDRHYYWANQADTWNGRTHRDNTVARWAAALQNDFAARMDWCVAEAFEQANHPPLATLNGDQTKEILQLSVKPSQRVQLSADGSTDPDNNSISSDCFVYAEAGSCPVEIKLTPSAEGNVSFVAPSVQEPSTVHVVLQLKDDGTPSLTAYRRAVITITP